MEERFGASSAKAKQLKFHTQTAGSTLTAQQVENNVVRVAYQALAAVLGGTQSLHTNGKDEALALPTEKSVRTALRTQQILAHESGVADTIDPLGGSYYIESLTDDLESEARGILAEIEDRGGMLAAVENQWVQRQIQDVAYQRQEEVENQERIIVGVNKYEAEEDPDVKIQEVTEEDAARQIKQLNQTRDERDDADVEVALSALKTAAEGSDNLLPYIITAVKAYATIGEICDVLRDVFGTHEPGAAV
jgi:methylmalonyl-CoA mutase N-terminal domain/subunit